MKVVPVWVGWFGCALGYVGGVVTVGLIWWMA